MTSFFSLYKGRYLPSLETELSAPNVDTTETDKDLNTPLHLACAFNDRQTCELLIRLKYPLDKENRVGITPLQYACMFANLEVIDILLAHGPFCVSRFVLIFCFYSYHVK